MSDRLRLVTRAADGTPTTVRDYEDGATYAKARDSFQIVPPTAKAIVASTVRRYGGSRVVGETHENGAIKWTAAVTGATADAVLENVEAMLAELLIGSPGYHLEWRPDGASGSTFYEVRGPATYNPSYRWVEFSGARFMPVDVVVPVAPLAEGEVVSQTASGVTIPGVVQLATDVPGTARAKADIALELDPVNSIAWGLVAWWARQATPTATWVPPLGVIHAERSEVADLNPSLAPTSHASYAGGSGLESTDGAFDFVVPVDYSVAAADDFAIDTLDIEYWACLRLASTRAGASVVTRALFGSTAEHAVYTHEYGSRAKSLTVPASGTEKRMMRLGIITSPTRINGQGAKGALHLSFSGGSGVLGVDYIVAVPARQRATLPTGIPFDSAYPRFSNSTSEHTKAIRHDLTTATLTGSGALWGPTGAFGGAPIELPPGDVDILVELSNTVPDNPDPSTDAADDATHTADITVSATARHFLARPS